MLAKPLVDGPRQTLDRILERRFLWRALVQQEPLSVIFEAGDIQSRRL